MGQKKLDNRIRVLIDNGVALGHRSMFVIVGDRGRDQVPILHHLLSKAQIKARPSVLWCYKKELGFTSHKRKKMKRLEKRAKTGSLGVNEDDPFELFIASTNIRYCYYKETHKILGNTYGMCVLQDFEAITPNLLARTIETVEGGGLVCLLLRSMNSLRQLYTMAMDVHSRYRTESHQEVVGRFNERFLLSLASCGACLVMNDSLDLLPLSSKTLSLQPVEKQEAKGLSPEEQELRDLKESLQDTQPVAACINLARTLDQAKAILKFIDAISDKSLRCTVSLTAARGRGKSAALGIAVASAVAFGYTNIFVTSPSPENLNTFFDFVFKTFDALEYEEHLDYELVQSTNPEFNKAIIRVNIFRDHRQTIQYVHPTDSMKLGQAELLVIDEAAAIPLPLVKELLGPYLVFLASTINGYEGTGRSLSLKLLSQLRSQSASIAADRQKESSKATPVQGRRMLHECTLEDPIRYKAGDPVETWLNGLLCLDASKIQPISSGCPVPQDCELYYINRDTLFCYHKASEMFLQRLMSLYVASHYKNTPNDLQMLSDAPAHHLFCLLPPIDPNKTSLPEVLCVLQVCLEGEISRSSVQTGLTQGKRAAGDLIPWTIAQQFQDEEFPRLAGARVVRIATHPDYQGMGYGSRALDLLERYFVGEMVSLTDVSSSPSKKKKEEEIRALNDENQLLIFREEIAPRNDLPPLLTKLSERKPEALDYLGVSYGVTAPLLKFWKKSGFVPVYLRQTANELTGEHSCIMLKQLVPPDAEKDSHEQSWLRMFWTDFQRRFISLLGFSFRSFSPQLALGILQNNSPLIIESTEPTVPLSKQELLFHLSPYDIKRLDLYARNMADYHLITDLLPAITRMYFTRQLAGIHLSAAQAAIFAGLGLQRKAVDKLSSELDLEPSQLLGLFNRSVKKIVVHLNEILETAVEKSLEISGTGDRSIGDKMSPLKISLEKELSDAAREMELKQKRELQKLREEDLKEFVIKGSEEEWTSIIEGKTKGGNALQKNLKRSGGENSDSWKKKKKKKFQKQ